jgi:quercetin dioxygenase-like cupin family protein
MRNILNTPTLVKKLKNSPNWAKGNLDAIVILKRPDKQILITAVHNGTEIKSFHSGDSITFHIIEGKLVFHTQKKSIVLNEGRLFTLYENIKYKLTSRGDTIFILTITKNILSRTTANTIRAQDTGVMMQ